METIATKHATLFFERTVPARRRAVFAAYADPQERVRWGAPSETATLIYDQAEFRVGGVDRFRCGSRQDPRFRGTTWYVEISPGRRIVSCELIETEGKPLSAALTTLELEDLGEHTRLTATVQVASFAGDDMLAGYETGNNGSLDNLVSYFEASRSA